MNIRMGICTLLMLMIGMTLIACDVDVKENGKLPEVDVKAGKLPDVDVDTIDVDVGTKKIKTKVPDVDLEEKEITVPDVDIKLPDNDEDEE